MRSLTYDIEFRARAKRTQAWGFGLLSLAALLWVWFGVLLLTPYDAGYQSDCEARLFTDRSTANEGHGENRCTAERDWPELLGVLGLSVPVSVVGAVLFTSASVSNRMAEHLAEVTRLTEAAERAA
ncbi:hypothetical protein OH805_06535 [Streptomyces sp. NBC_00879]|uniref:hypothetical protein n=1 Tax=unclassified Streptomyces TaxID=2593676 RepID=UPI00386D4FDF|nr:hypothetical protein OHA61_06925 [Streptomyces sp. NBC_00885]WSY73804.1 hypothetical protein OH805_06535 [Streptomyces sp. NBC_00879]